MRIFYIAALFILTIHSAVFGQDAAVPITGFVDMHTHPRSDLAFGTELFYGAPYGDIAVELKNCRADHSKNFIRAQLAKQTEQQNNPAWKDGKEGYPDFTTWPSWCAILHQQMWIDWIERAHKGGLNIIVALAVSNHCIGYAAKDKGPLDDEQVLLNSIQGIKDLVAHSTFMEIALTPQDVRRIVAGGKLAVILGSEMDNIGNFYSPADHYKKAAFNPAPSNEQIQAELDKLWNLGLRYIFPIHLMNNAFGGTALGMSTLNVASKFSTGTEFIPEQVSTQQTGIAFHLEHPIIGMNAVAKMFMPLLLPKNIDPSRKKNYTFWEIKPGYGHRNSLGLSARGRFAIRYMMKKGFLIDIDHMSEKTAAEALGMAVKAGYPLNSGHNNPRGAAGAEGGRTLAQYAQLKQLGGMIGMGHGDKASDFVRSYREVAKIMAYSHVAIGTDVNGFYPLPKKDESIHVVYDSALTRCKTGNRTWDINTDGFAHYGLFPDFIRSCELAGMTAQEEKTFMASAEHFTQMWEKCEQRKGMLGY
jgi:microsomal dipeptidase-like Zn-dependent dipeptidase